MSRLVKGIPQAILYISIILAVHLIIIYFLEIRIEGWDAEAVTLMLKTYFLPLLLCFLNSLLFIGAKRIGHFITWFLFTLIPSSLLLFLFVDWESAEVNEDASFISWEIPKYAIEMIYLLPAAIMIIQLIMSLYYLINVKVWTDN